MGDASSPARSATATPAPSASISQSVPLRIITHNIRYAADPPEESELRWPDRFPKLSAHFKYHTRPQFTPPSTLVCMQEVLHPQLEDLLCSSFNSNVTPEENDWDSVGVGRNDGKQGGEYSPIFYRRSAWTLLHFDTVWLNETRTVGKKGWDAASIRILTIAVLESNLPDSKGRTILAMNTHLDDSGVVARREAAKIILHVTSTSKEQFPSISFIFLAGDLNSPPNDDAYKLLNTRGSGFIDTRRVVLDEDVYGDEKTFTGFPQNEKAKGKWRIDYVHLGIKDDGDDNELAAEKEKVRGWVKGYGVLPNRFDDRVWMTDHRAVVVDLVV
ncbi:uncharacterized protein A1O9_11797 [Exophiala aquamarina CBS 119918]|uniref:Endonuclease/exonuclease/phosphatase domain-containing protein n=1 Tax=Exophiala aquamarina CBS 119918 TaxID=1182545 RepID=A0A072P9B4_9EURO|nr:uncharacterized protein A1O9_11797 [Exophiala aquamarina CBS 119918]KEF52170.1 hypothetical protein A1O9_11797 [Exophiala aquamarina CBS 119918]